MTTKEIEESRETREWERKGSCIRREGRKVEMSQLLSGGAFCQSPFLAPFLAASQIICLDLFIAVFVAQVCRVFLVADY